MRNKSKTQKWIKNSETLNTRKKIHQSWQIYEKDKSSSFFNFRATSFYFYIFSTCRFLVGKHNCCCYDYACYSCYWLLWQKHLLKWNRNIRDVLFYIIYHMDCTWMKNKTVHFSFAAQIEQHKLLRRTTTGYPL